PLARGSGSQRWRRGGTRKRPFELALLCLDQCCGATARARNVEESTLVRPSRGARAIKFLADFIFRSENFVVSPDPVRQTRSRVYARGRRSRGAGDSSSLRFLDFLRKAPCH